MVAAVLVISPDDEPSNNDKWTMVGAVLLVSPDDEPSNNDKWIMVGCGLGNIA